MKNLFTKKQKHLWVLSFFTTVLGVLFFSGAWGTVYSYTITRVEIIKTLLLDSSQDFSSAFVNQQNVSLVDGISFEQDEILQISAGLEHTCTLYKSGSIRCSGNNFRGMLGDGTTVQKESPVEVIGISNAVQVSAGGVHTCALLDDGSAKCWGANQSSELGDETFDTRLVPVQVLRGLPSMRQIVASPSPYPLGGSDQSYTCALLQDKTVSCWGENGSYQLGNGTTDESEFLYTNVANLSNVRSIDISIIHSCALIEDGTVKCWGVNGIGALSTAVPIASPALRAEEIPGLANVQKISVGDFHGCALIDGGDVKCWGWNGFGQVGGAGAILRLVPYTVVTGAVDITTGKDFSCAELSNGKVQCWGNDSTGALGNGGDINDGNSFVPVDVIGINDPDAIEAGGTHICALKNNVASCWGANDYGQLGDGTTDSNFIAEAIDNIRAYKSATSSIDFRFESSTLGENQEFGGWKNISVDSVIPLGTNVNYTLGVYDNNACLYDTPLSNVSLDFSISPTDASAIPTEYKDICLKIDFLSSDKYLSPKITSISAKHIIYNLEKNMGSGKSYFSGTSRDNTFLYSATGAKKIESNVIKSGHRSFIAKYDPAIQSIFDSYNKGIPGKIETYINRNGYEVFLSYKKGRVGKDRFKRKPPHLAYRGRVGTFDVKEKRKNIQGNYLSSPSKFYGSAPSQENKQGVYRGNKNSYSTAETYENAQHKKLKIREERQKWERRVTRDISKSKIKKGPRNIKMVINGKSVPVDFMVD